MGMKAGPASALVVETLGLEGQLTPQQFLTDRELILHKTFATAILMPGRCMHPPHGDVQFEFVLIEPCKYAECEVVLLESFEYVECEVVLLEPCEHVEFDIVLLEHVRV